MTTLSSIQTLNRQIQTCSKCRLSLSRQHALPGEGSLSSRVLLIAQSPGKVEDAKNRMFIGPSGKLFNELLEHAGISRETIYLTNLIKCMLPNSRRPSQNEIKQCTVYLDKEIELIRPKLIVPLGFHSTRFIFMKYHIPRPPKNEYHILFGRTFHSAGLDIYPLRHPTALLFNPEKRKMMEENYKMLNKLLPVEE
ncbi:MAG: uracil-DNA glycosylase [Bacteroidales bacterium]|nr:uracil-DNA glycosylase [Bacteroidales bacterium]